MARQKTQRKAPPRARTERALAPHEERRQPAPPVPMGASEPTTQNTKPASSPQARPASGAGLMANSAEYRRLRRIWWGLLISAAVVLFIALILTSLRRVVGMFGVTGQYVGLGLEVVAALLLVATWVFDLKMIRPLVRKARREAQYQAKREQALQEEGAPQPVVNPALAQLEQKPQTTVVAPSVPPVPRPAPQPMPTPAPKPVPIPASKPVIPVSAPVSVPVTSQEPIGGDVMATPSVTAKKSTATKKAAAPAKKAAAAKKPAAKKAAVAAKPAAKKAAAPAKKVAAAAKPAAAKKPAAKAAAPAKKVAAAKPAAAKKPAAAAKKPAAKKPAAKKAK